MKIALIGNEYQQQFPLRSYGGIEASVEQLAWGLHKAKADFFCVVPSRVKEAGMDYPFEILEAPFVPSFLSKRSPYEFAQSVAEILKVKKPDIIWSQSHWSIQPLLSLNIPIICTFSDSCPKQPGWIIPEKNVYYRFVSKFQYKLWVREDWERARSLVIYNGLEDSEYDFGEEPEDYFLWVAGLVWGWHGKGLDVFLELAKRNLEKRFVAYGTGSAQIEQELKNLEKTSPNFRYGGELKRGPGHRETFRKARALIMPTQIPEALGRTILESLSKGTPVIGSGYGSLPEIIKEHGVTSDEIEVLDQALDRKFDRRACFEYSKRFSVNHEVKQMLQATERVLASSSLA
jgi:glycosyltransferase involved in cell wall biosynthesis